MSRAFSPLRYLLRLHAVHHLRSSPPCAHGPWPTGGSRRLILQAAWTSSTRPGSVPGFFGLTGLAVCLVCLVGLVRQFADLLPAPHGQTASACVFGGNPDLAPAKTKTGIGALSSGSRTKTVWNILTMRSDMVTTLLGAPGLTTRSKDATRGSWHRY